MFCCKVRKFFHPLTTFHPFDHLFLWSTQFYCSASLHYRQHNHDPRSSLRLFLNFRIYYLYATEVTLHPLIVLTGWIFHFSHSQQYEKVKELEDWKFGQCIEAYTIQGKLNGTSCFCPCFFILRQIENTALN